MEFLLIARDGTDAAAIQRRIDTRPAHQKSVKKYHDDNTFMFASAIINDKGEAVGSALVVDFKDRAELDAWLKVEPYATQKVWQNIEILRLKPGSDFPSKKKY